MPIHSTTNSFYRFKHRSRQVRGPTEYRNTFERQAQYLQTFSLRPVAKMQTDDLTLDVSEESTPSPSVSMGDSTTPATSNGSASRRPPRKSTLTQQQKNQKRQRATQDQLVTLEVEFNKNPTPTAAVRERIAQEINMTERSVQIWFQNR